MDSWAKNDDSSVNREFPADSILPLSCLSRTPGNVAHWREAMCKSSFLRLYTTFQYAPFIRHVLTLTLSNKPRNPLSGVLNKSTLEISLSAVMAAKTSLEDKGGKAQFA